MLFEIQNPVDLAGWDNDIHAFDGSSIFHTSAWAAVFAKAYHYRPVYITQYKDDRLSALLPVMEINSFLTGKRGVSLPFTDACSPLADTEEQYKALIQFSLRYAASHHWRTLEFRTDKPLPLSVAPSHPYLRHRLDLGNTNSDLKRKMRKSTMRNVRRALRSGVSVNVSQTLQSVRDYFRLNCLTRKHHGLPPQPWYFFKAVYEKIIRQNLGHVFLARLDDKSIAGSIFFRFLNRAYYKYGASDLAYQKYRANNLVMWEALQYYRARGCVFVDFGRTEMGHPGLRQFKRGWGADEDRLYYYLYHIKQRAFMTRIQNAPPGNPLLRKMPVSLLRLIGHFLYPHVG